MHSMKKQGNKVRRLGLESNCSGYVIARQRFYAELGSGNGAIPYSRIGDCFASLAMTPN